MQQNPSIEKYFKWLVIVLLVSLIPGLFTPLMEPDAALYASISKQIIWRNDWVNLFVYNEDWLDKPHLPFWISALSFKLLGISSFAYKLPGFICWIWGGWYTYLFARQFYGKQAAQLAVLIYLTALHAIISASDIRAEPYLTLFLIAASWHLMQAIDRSRHIVPAALFTALALMTKGPFILIPLGAGLVLHWIIKGDFRQFLQIKWYFYLILAALFTLPELLTLYWQFDAHPEKTVFGRNGVSGIQFFLWDSQFGRFFNSGPIKGKGDPFFFLHTLLWAFLPWSLLLYAAAYNKLSGICKRVRAAEYFCFSAAFITMLVFSLSKFQLPHYLNILFPYFSILTGAFLIDLWPKKSFKTALVVQRVISLLMMVLPIGVVALFRPPIWYVFPLIAILFIYFWFAQRKQPPMAQLVLVSAGSSLLLGLFLNIFFYPTLLTYQGGPTAAQIKNAQFPKEPVYLWEMREPSTAFDFYNDANTYIASSSNLTTLQQDLGGVLIYTGKVGMKLLEEESLALQRNSIGENEVDSIVANISETKNFTIEAIIPNFRITRLQVGFLNPTTRATKLDSVYLIRIHPAGLAE